MEVNIYLNILFLTLVNMIDINEHNIYSDLLREIIKHGHDVYVVSPVERRNKKKTHIISAECVQILKPRIGNIQKANLIEKGISTIMVGTVIKRSIAKYWKQIKFDLVLYSTPPITFTSPIEYIKKRDGAITYLMLKDIFPQNSIDIGLLSTKGVKGLIYRYFREKEKKLYSLSSRIGCMSPANVKYLLNNNPDIEPNKVDICPNSIEVIDLRVSEEQKLSLRQEYDLPTDKIIFVYGGNLGKPQDIPFVLECIEECKNIENVYFVIVGDGTEYSKVEEFVFSGRTNNLKLIKYLPREKFELLVAACDVGLVFLDHRFTIPNFPSRLLSYMQSGLPVLAATDVNTDVGSFIEKNEFGWWCESNDKMKFKKKIIEAIEANLEGKSNNAVEALNEFSVEKSYLDISHQIGLSTKK